MNNTPSSDPQTPLGILRKAYDSVKNETEGTDHGNSWVKGLYRKAAQDRQGKHYTQQCMIGALSEACGKDHGYFGQVEYEAAGLLAEAMYETLVESEDSAKVLAARRNGTKEAAVLGRMGSIPTMNDDPSTEWQDVDAAFLKAIKKAEEKQCGTKEETEAETEASADTSSSTPGDAEKKTYGLEWQPGDEPF